VNSTERYARANPQVDLCEGCDKQLHTAERELMAFMAAVTELYGSRVARIAADDWILELELISSPSKLTDSDFRRNTIAASAKLANRLHR
jgi:hypothetical protein